MFEVFSVAYILNIFTVSSVTFYICGVSFLHRAQYAIFLSSAHTFSLSFSLSIGTVPYRVNVSQYLVFNGIVLVF